MTKLFEWLSVFAILFGLWFALLTNRIENSFSVEHPILLLWSPVLFIILFGIYAAAVVLYRVFTFNNCKEAAAELQEDIRNAKADLEKLGFKMPSK